MTMKRWLIGWGILSLIALAAPGVVAAGMFFIIPGLILLAAPTVCLYSAMFALLRRLLGPRPNVLGNVAAGLAALFLGWLMAQPGAMAGRRAFARANLPDIVPESGVRLAGDIRLELPENVSAFRDERDQCGPLCAALLDTPRVNSVTISPTSVRFRLVPVTEGHHSRGVALVHPERILAELPKEDERGDGKVALRIAAREEDKQAVAATWALRLATRERLVREAAPGGAGMTIRVIEERRHRNEVSVSRLEIVDQIGSVLLRRSIVTGSALAAPLRFGGEGSLESFRVRLARDRLSDGSGQAEMNAVTELFRHSSLARPAMNRRAAGVLMDRIHRATGNPLLPDDDADLGAASLWLSSMPWKAPLAPEEIAVLGGVIADKRIPLPDGLYSGYESKVAPELRGALASRIRNAATRPQTRLLLAKLLARMPEGTFGQLLADEAAVLESADLRADAYPLIVRMADGGEAAVPALVAMLKSDQTLEPIHRRIWVMRALALAFATLGPKAADAIAVVDAIVNARRSPVLHDWGDRERWYLALARMGKPVEELHWFTDKPEAIARHRAGLRTRLKRFNPRDVWRY